METFKQRLQRFENNSPLEFIETILNSVDNYYINEELTVASEKRLSNILVLGMHSTIETISEKIFLKKGIDGFKFYLENFVDGDGEGFRFSEIAYELNSWRNIIAHQYISNLGHSLGYDYDIQAGYRMDDSVLVLNPTIYFEQFRDAFRRRGKKGKTKHCIWDYREFLNESDLDKAKREFIQIFKRY